MGRLHWCCGGLPAPAHVGILGSAQRRATRLVSVPTHSPNDPTSPPARLHVRPL